MTIDLEHAISQLISMGFGLNRAEAISRLKVGRLRPETLDKVRILD